jgi:Transposase DDE domain
VKNKNTKPSYHIRNWKQYNSSLVGRGSLTVWFDPKSLHHWINLIKPSGRGRPLLYADAAILCCLIIREVYHLPLRQTQGLVRSIIQLLQIKLPVPHYSLLSRRAHSLQVKLTRISSKKIKHLVMDASGLKVYGEGEWKVRLHGTDKRRTWRKLHISMDAETHQIKSVLLTNKDVVDPRCLPKLLKQVEEPVERVYGDGAYDSRQCYRAIYKRKARPIIPVRKGSALWEEDYLKERNRNLRQVRKLGLEGWKDASGYHKRSLVETAFFRLKRIFSDKLRSRRDDTQAAEARIRCAALNRMTELGMPDSYRV